MEQIPHLPNAIQWVSRLLGSKLCSVKSTRSLSSIVAVAEFRLQELNELSGKPWTADRPKNMGLSRQQLQTSQYASYKYRVTSTITIHCRNTTRNLSTTSREETRDQKKRTATWPHRQYQTIVEQKQAIHFQTIGEQKQENNYDFTNQTADTTIYIISQDIFKNLN